METSMTLTTPFLTFLLLLLLTLLPSTSGETRYPLNCIWCKGRDPYSPPKEKDPHSYFLADEAKIFKSPNDCKDYTPEDGRKNYKYAMNCVRLHDRIGFGHPPNLWHWMCIEYPGGEGHGGCVDKTKFGNPENGECRDVDGRRACFCNSEDMCNNGLDKTDPSAPGTPGQGDRDENGNPLLPGQGGQGGDGGWRRRNGGRCRNKAPLSGGGGPEWITVIWIFLGLLYSF